MIESIQQGVGETDYGGFFSATMFTCIVIVLAYYGWKVYKGNITMPFQPRGTPQKGIIVVTALIFLIFVSRAIYDAISQFVNNIALEVDTGLTMTDFGVFLLFNWWEILPTTVVILLFWRIPSTKPARKYDQYAVDRKDIAVQPINDKSWDDEDSSVFLDMNPAPFSARVFTQPRVSPLNDGNGSGSGLYNPRSFLPDNSPYSPYSVTAPRPTGVNYGTSPHMPLIRDS